MIITLLLQFSYLLLSGFHMLLSGAETLDPNISGAIQYAVNSINEVSYLIPVNSLFWALSLVLAFEFSLWSFKGAVWVYRHIPFLGH